MVPVFWHHVLLSSFWDWMSDIHLDDDYTLCQKTNAFNKQCERILKGEDTNNFQYVKSCALLHKDLEFIECYCSRTLSWSQEAINSDLSHTSKWSCIMIISANYVAYQWLFWKKMLDKSPVHSQLGILPQEVHFLSAYLQD